MKAKWAYPNIDSNIAKRELEAGFITYATLADRVGNKVMMNNVLKRWAITLEQISGFDDEDETAYPEIFQLFAVTEWGAEVLQDVNEIVFWDEELETYFWGVTHYGTSWDYVFTDIEVVH